MAFYPGQKVVCVNDQWATKWRQHYGKYPCPLRRGAVYTVVQCREEFGWSTAESLGSYPCVVLAEVRHPDGRVEGFDASRFRPLTERSTETGMEILRKIADGQPVREGMEA